MKPHDVKLASNTAGISGKYKHKTTPCGDKRAIPDTMPENRYKTLGSISTYFLSVHYTAFILLPNPAVVK